MHRTMGSVAIAKGLVIAVDFSGLVHCLDAKTGKRHWSHDAGAAIWTSPLIADDKVYVADEDGNVLVFQFGTDSKHAEPIATVPHSEPIYASPVYADGTLYVAKRNALFAVDAAEARRWHERAGDWPMPILFNEDDHYDFDTLTNNFRAAIDEYASWGYFDYRMKGESFDDGYQSVPVNWRTQQPAEAGILQAAQRGHGRASLTSLAGDCLLNHSPRNSTRARRSCSRRSLMRSTVTSAGG